MVDLNKVLEDTVLLEAAADLAARNWREYRRTRQVADKYAVKDLLLFGWVEGIFRGEPGQIPPEEGIEDALASIYLYLRDRTTDLNLERTTDFHKHEDILTDAEFLRNRGFDISVAKGQGAAQRGFNKPVIYDLDHVGIPIRTIVAKTFTKPESLRKEMILSRVLSNAGINVLPMREIGIYGGSHTLYSAFEIDYTVEESIANGTYSNELERWIVKSIAKLNIEGARFLREDFPEYLERWKDRIHQDTVRTGVCDCHELFLTTAAESLVESLDDLTTEEGKSYRTELVRRIKEYGFMGNPEESEFVQHFIAKYIEPMMKLPSVLGHNDCQVANMFSSSGKLFDLESVCYQAFGDDLAKFETAKYSQTGKYSGVDADRIVRENNISALFYLIDAHRQNETLSQRLIYSTDEFMESLKMMVVHSALTTAMQRMKNYNANGEQFQEDISYGNFSIFYASIDSDEREMFDREFENTHFGRFIERYKAGAQPEPLGPHSHEGADHVMGEPHNVGHVHQ